MCIYVLQVLLKFTCGCVVGWMGFQGSHIAIHLVTDGGHVCSAPGDLPGDLWCRAFLHSLLMSAIVVSNKFADAILIFCLRGDSVRLRYLRCCAMSSSAPTWTSSIFAYFWYFQFVTYKSLSGYAMLRSQIPILQ